MILSKGNQGSTNPKKPASGVLVTNKGHIFTAAHVIEAAVDEGSQQFDLYTIKNAKISVQFLDNNDKLDPKMHSAIVIFYSVQPDVAVLQIDPDSISEKAVPIVDMEMTQLQCTFCYSILGYTNQKFEIQAASPNNAPQESFKRMVTSNMAPVVQWRSGVSHVY